MARRSVLLAMALALGAWAAVAPARDDAVQPEPAAQAGSQKQAPADSGAGGQQKAKPTGWWNAPDVADAVKLSEQQRQQMDMLQARHQAQAEAAGRQRRELNDQIQAAFVAADLAKARELTGAMDKMASSGTEQNALKLEILGLLSPAQLEVLKAQYPRVLSEPWRRNTARLVAAKDKSGRSREGKTGRHEGRKADADAKKGETGPEQD